MGQSQRRGLPRAGGPSQGAGERRVCRTEVRAKPAADGAGREGEEGEGVPDLPVESHLPSRPFLQSFFVDLATSGPMVLDVLQRIKAEQDPSLSYRRSCREGICGSCAMNIDGLNNLACLKPIDNDASRPSMITPPSHVRRQGPRPGNGREYRQSPAERKKLDGLYECILCACCSGACPEYWWNPESFLGPATLLQAYRWVSDSRDEYTAERLQALTEDRDKLHRCRRVGNCTANCPKSLDPEKAIETMKQEHLYPSFLRPLHSTLSV
ncbi:unnamed protein product [Spirodela intermedia]|uniref:Succinate dehydrogenase [ubiquinone] iron-sulfur subunit, mitochondrial n=1 Tax=Spirodela intermedia TaxID=51605 RepID=A0A7I8J4N6_SPIIN|nr:unnamed protein product [Spirodela intermedia]CAA6665051.1 unnamed protein product [Spirodela intermedia]